MLSRKGFTLVELMVVILIVAILAAVAIPIMRGRIDAAKWSEGKAMMGTIASSIRAHVAERNPDYTVQVAGPAAASPVDWVPLGLLGGDFNGTYFSSANFSWTVDYNPQTNVLQYLITCDNAGTTVNSPTQVTLNEAGAWVETP